MNRILLVVAIVTSCYKAHSQSLIHLRGTVIELLTKKPVKDVSVDLKRDGSYIYNDHRWCMTDSLGNYDYITDSVLPGDSLVFNHVTGLKLTFSVEDSLLVRMQLKGSDEYDDFTVRREINDDSVLTIAEDHVYLTKKQHRHIVRKVHIQDKVERRTDFEQNEDRKNHIIEKADRRIGRMNWREDKRSLRSNRQRFNKELRHEGREDRRDNRRIKRHRPITLRGWVKFMTDNDTAHLQPVRGSVVTLKRTKEHVYTGADGYFFLLNVIVGRDTVVVTGQHEKFVMPVNKQFLEIKVRPEIHIELYIDRTTNCSPPLTKKQKRQILRKNNRHFRRYLDGVS